MENEIFKLRKKHVNFNKLLSLLDAELDLLHRGETPDYQLMTDILYYMTQYVDLIYHPKEDAISALIVERDPSAAELMAELNKQRNEIIQSGACYYEKLENIINSVTEITQRQEIEIAGRQYNSILRAYMDNEEQDFFKLAEKLLNDDDWKKINSDTLTKPDPIFGAAIEDRFHLVCDKLTQSASNK